MISRLSGKNVKTLGRFCFNQVRCLQCTKSIHSSAGLDLEKSEPGHLPWEVLFGTAKLSNKIEQINSFY